MRCFSKLLFLEHVETGFRDDNDSKELAALYLRLEWESAVGHSFAFQEKLIKTHQSRAVASPPS